MTRVNSIQKTKSVILPVLKRHGVIKAGIFGSYARGEAKRKSDVDILVQLQKGKSLLDLAGLEIALEKALKKKVDLVTYKSVHPLLRNNIFKDEVRVL